MTSTFYGRSNVYSSTHLHLSEAASTVICSKDLTFPSCSDGDSEYNEKLPAGFSNRTERGYVAAIIFVGATCVVLVIVVFCVFHEGEVMRKERQGITIPETRNLVLNNDAAEQDDTSSLSEGETDEAEDDQRERRWRGRGRGRGRVTGRGGERGERRVTRSVIKRGRPSVTYSVVSMHH